MPLNSTLAEAQIVSLENVYRFALGNALSTGEPILLTQLFDYDEAVGDRCIYAMLSPIKNAIAEGKRTAVHIRVTSKNLHEKICAAIKSGLKLIEPLSMRPFVEIKKKTTETDLQCLGMMMVTRDTQNLFEKAPHNIFFRIDAEYGGTDRQGFGASRTGGRKKRAFLFFRGAVWAK